MNNLQDLQEFKYLKKLGVDIGNLSKAKNLDNVIVWKPQEGKQKLVFELLTTKNDITRVFYGGGKGCGKTEIGLEATIEVMLKYGSSFNGLYIRANMTSLADIIGRFETKLKIYGVKYTFGRQGGVLKLSNGATLRFFYADKGLLTLDGGNYNWIVLEEPQYFKDLESDLDMIERFFRTTDSTFPKKLIMFFNPLGNSMSFFKNELMTHENKVITIKKNDAKIGYKRVFIKGTIYDNPLLIKQDPEYLDKLLSLSKDLKEAYLYGNIPDTNSQPFERKLKKVDLETFDLINASMIVATLDLAYGGKDSTALSIVTYTTEDNAPIVLNGGIWNKHWENCIDDIENLLNLYEIDTFYYEANIQGLSGTKRFMEERGIEATPLYTSNQKSKQEKIQEAVTSIDTLYINQDIDEDYFKQVRDWRPSATKDDAPDSIAMALDKLGYIWKDYYKNKRKREDGYT